MRCAWHWRLSQRQLVGHACKQRACGQSHVLRHLCFLLRCSSHTESSRDMTSHPGYGRSPAKRMCIGHFSECASSVLHVHAARVLFFMSCRSRCSRAAASLLQLSHTMLCVWSFSFWTSLRGRMLHFQGACYKGQRTDIVQGVVRCGHALCIPDIQLSAG